MKHNNSVDEPIFVPYDDENIEHVLSGPDYGQVNSGSKHTAWTELESSEYPDYVSEIKLKILKRSVFKI